MNIKENLKSAGLTENEAKVYEALLEMGSRSAGVISRRTGLHRRVIYDVLDRLIKKGLVGYIVENNKKIFSVSNPERFLEIVDEEKNNLNVILPTMLEIFNQSKERQKEETVFFKGKNGLKSVFEDQIEEAKKSKEILILGASDIAYELFENYFFWFDKKRQENKINARIIFNSEKSSRKIPLSKIKFLPKELSSEMSLNIYGNKVAIIYWEKDRPFAIVINQKQIAEGYRKYFEFLWGIAK
jgi:sugar-specific transcriptional regulator TrmB